MEMYVSSTLKAAEQEKAEAQNAMGAMYGKGLGVPQNYRAAMTWYRKAAAQGHAKAQNNIGFMYLNGQGVRKELPQAYAWFTLAATAGNADAQRNKPIAAAGMTADQIARGEALARDGPSAVIAAEPSPCESQASAIHPEIKWVDDLSCILDGKGDTATIGATEYLESGDYRFIGECRKSGGVIERVFEYKDKGRPYLLRLNRNVDPLTYVVISSHPKGDGRYHHNYFATNRYKKVAACLAEASN